MQQQKLRGTLSRDSGANEDPTSRALLQALKKFSYANRQLLSVAKHVLSKSTSDVLSSQIRSATENLIATNKVLIEDQKAASTTTNLQYVKSVVTKSSSISNSSSYLIALCKSVTLELEEPDLFSSVGTAAKTVRDTLFVLVDILIDAPMEWQDPLAEAIYYGAAKSVEKALSQLLADRAKMLGASVVPAHERAEIVGAVDALVSCITQLIYVYSDGSSTYADVAEQIKIGATLLSQLCSAVTECVGRSDLALSHDLLMDSVQHLMDDLKASFQSLVDQARIAIPLKGSKEQTKALYEASTEIRKAVTTLLAAVLSLAEVNLAEMPNEDLVIPPDFVELAIKKVEDMTPPPPPQAPKEEKVHCTDDGQDDCNIWEEPPDSEANVLFSTLGTEGEPKLRAGTFNKLVGRLTSYTFKDVNFMHAFVTTYRSFTTPVALFNKLMERYEVPESESKNKLAIQSRVLNVLRYWVENRYADLDPPMVAKVQEFAAAVENGGSQAFASVGRSVLSIIDRKQRARERMVDFDALVLEPKIPISPSRLLFVFNEEEVAKQLTLIDFEVFSAVQPTELLNQAWAKRKHLARNIHVLVQRSNRVTLWVASMILWQRDLRDRIRVLTRIINIAIQLRKLNNFNSLMNFVSALNNAAVHRLQHTFAGLSPDLVEAMEELRAVMTPGQSYANYRRTLRALNPPCIPFLGVYLTDLTFIDEGNPERLHGLINFAKQELVHNTIADIQHFQRLPYAYDFVDQLGTFLRELPRNTEDDLWNLSMLREPRGASKEEID